METDTRLRYDDTTNSRKVGYMGMRMWLCGRLCVCVYLYFIDPKSIVTRHVLLKLQEFFYVCLFKQHMAPKCPTQNILEAGKASLHNFLGNLTGFMLF